jgi:fatty acid hydroxylase family protein
VASFHALVWWQYALWNLAGFGGAVLANSFVEWATHRWFMHRRSRILPWAYELHAVSHHGMFGADETYHAQDDEMRAHVTFVPRDYILILAANAPLWCAAEWLCGRPVLAGCFLATLGGLQAFNTLHWAMHVPADNWLQRRGLFKFLKEHHRLHHRRQDRNLNVVFPLADLVLGTLVTKDAA